MIIQGPLSSISNIDAKWIDQCRQGRWFHWTRIYLVKSECGIHVISLNLFQRLAKVFSQLANSDYFAKIVKSKTIEILNPDSLDLHKIPSPAVGVATGQQPKTANPPNALNTPIRDPNKTPLKDTEKLFYKCLHDKIKQRQQATLLQISPFDPTVQIPHYPPKDFRRSQDCYAAVEYMLRVEKSIVGYGVKSFEPGAGDILIKVSPNDFVDPNLILEKDLTT